MGFGCQEGKEVKACGVWRAGVWCVVCGTWHMARGVKEEGLAA